MCISTVSAFERLGFSAILRGAASALMPTSSGSSASPAGANRAPEPPRDLAQLALDMLGLTVPCVAGDWWSTGLELAEQNSTLQYPPCIGYHSADILPLV